MDVDEESVTTDGVKISMFDISDPADVKEEETYVLEDLYGTDVGYNYKAVFVDLERKSLRIYGIRRYSRILHLHPMMKTDSGKYFQEN